MKQLCICALLLLICLSAAQLHAAPQNNPYAHLPGFTLHKMGQEGSGPTLLVVGGIQGDEPGGFSAASLLATHYEIKKGSVWVVPNLNFPSIIKSSRGLHGDMNRKFALLSSSDPEYETVRAIQHIILEPQVDIVLNLHDGSGWYRPKWENNLKNPKRWGQCIVIDQERLDDNVVQNPEFQDLNAIALAVKDDVNVKLLRYLHSYRIKNTNTRDFDREMEKTLSYFAVRAGKAAFGLEASKELSAASRVYYHTCLLEAFMRHMGIEFERKFHLSPGGVSAALNSDISVALYNSRTIFKLDNARNVTWGYIPVHKGQEVELLPSNPLLAVFPDGKQWAVVYGNRTLTRFTPEYFDFDDSIREISVTVDGKTVKAQIGDMLKVDKSFTIKHVNGYRVNAIGAQKEKNGTEAGVQLKRDDFAERFSLDRDGNVYRVEFYKGKAYCGMVLVNFGPEKNPDIPNVPLTAGTEPIPQNKGR